MADAPDGIKLMVPVVIINGVPVLATEANEYLIDTYSTYSGNSATAQDLFNREVPADRKGILDEIELACDNYSVPTWYIEVKGVVIMNWEKLPVSFTKAFPMVEISAGQSVIVQVKSDGSTSINAYCDVSYKEVG